MEDFENSLEESDSGSELSDIGHDVPLGDGSCPTTLILESPNSSKSMVLMVDLIAIDCQLLADRFRQALPDAPLVTP